MEKFNENHPQDGNQIVVSKNSGTINIINHSKDNVEVMQKLLNNQKEVNVFLKEAFSVFEEIANEALKVSLKKSKRKSK